MEVLPFTAKNHDAIVRRVAWLLKCGGVAAVPTDTVYGLLADVLRDSAVEKVLRIKARSPAKAMPVLVRDIAMAKEYAVIDEEVGRLLAELWPGQTTVVLQRKRALPAVVSGGGNSVGLRLPDYQFLRDVLAAFPHPLVGTSANLSGNEPAESAAEVRQTFRHHVPQPDLLVDAGVLPPSPPSTVLDMTNSRAPRILRMGAITKEKLEEFLAHWKRT